MATKKSLSPASTLPVPVTLIERRIYLIRGQKVMLSTDLAELYEVEPRALVQAVKRNLDRFPEDFMFPLTQEEYVNLKSQFVISSWGGARRATPYAFTEQGVAMLSSVLHSKRAAQMNVLIIRTFVKLREVLATHKDLAAQMEKLHATQKQHGAILVSVVEEIKKLKAEPPTPPKRRIGFTPNEEQ